MTYNDEMHMLVKEWKAILGVRNSDEIRPKMDRMMEISTRISQISKLAIDELEVKEGLNIE